MWCDPWIYWIVAAVIAFIDQCSHFQPHDKIVSSLNVLILLIELFGNIICDYCHGTALYICAEVARWPGTFVHVILFRTKVYHYEIMK